MSWHNSQTTHRPQITLCLIASLVFSSVVAAQEPDPIDVIRVRTDMVAIPVTVTDAHRRRVSLLVSDDFVLSDDNRVARIEYFASGAERVAILFALDASGSTRAIVAQQRAAAGALFSRFSGGSRVAVLHFGDFVRLTVPFTTDTAAAQNAFEFEPKENSGTAIFDGAAAAVRSFDGSGGFSTERRIVLLMSDGLDTRSSTSYTTVVDLAQLRGVSFYVIHFPLFSPRDGGLAPRPPTKGFRELAEQTGGKYFRIGDARSALDPKAHYDLTPVFQEIENDLRAQYVLGFYPGDAARDGLTHQVMVSLKKRKAKLKVNQLKTSYSLKSEP